MSDIDQQTGQTPASDAVLKDYNRKLKKRRISALTFEEFAESVESVTKVALDLTKEPSVRDACHDVMRTLFKKWLPLTDIRITFGYVDQLVAAREATTSPALAQEINTILTIIDDQLEAAYRPKGSKKPLREKISSIKI